MTLGLVSLLAPRRNAILWHNLISLGSAARLCHKCGHSGMTQTLGPAAWLHVMQISDVLCKWPDSRVTDPSLRLLWSEFVNIFLADSQGPWAEKLWHDHSEWIKNRGHYNNANDGAAGHWQLVSELWLWPLLTALLPLLSGPIKIMSPPPPIPFSSYFLDNRHRFWL